ncbi:MAG: DUF2804 family protein [Actinomycetes bacterium]
MSAPTAWRGEYGSVRPAGTEALRLPPEQPRPVRRGHLLKQWRYVAVHHEEMQICAATIAVGPGRSTFWAIWDRVNRELTEGSHKRMTGVETPDGRLVIADGGVSAEFELDEVPGVETITPVGKDWTWTRKQGGIAARGRVTVNGRTVELEAPAIIDDSAGYHPRRTDWRWCSGVGTLNDGRPVAWNFVNGLNDTPGASEQTVWIDGEAHQTESPRISTDLSNVAFVEGGRLDFHEEEARGHAENLVIVRSSYTQPFGRFSGRLPHAGSLAQGLGVMETHSAVW